MTREEVTAILSILKAAYPAHYRGLSSRDAEAVVGLWHGLLSPFPAARVGGAVRDFIATDRRGFHPAPGEILARVEPSPALPGNTEEARYGAVVRSYLAAKRAAEASGADMDRWVSENAGIFPPPEGAGR